MLSCGERSSSSLEAGEVHLYTNQLPPCLARQHSRTPSSFPAEIMPTGDERFSIASFSFSRVSFAAGTCLEMPTASERSAACPLSWMKVSRCYNVR